MKKKTIFLLILLLAATFLRFFKLKEWFFFMVDEDTVNLVAKRIIIDKRPVLLGPDIPGGLHTGPLFYYLTALLMVFSGFNPIGEAIFSALFGILSAFLLFFIGEKIFSKRIAFFALVFYTFSSLVIIYNRTYNTLTFSLLATLLAYFTFFKLKEGKHKWIYLLSFSLILGTHSEGSGFSLILLTFLFFYFYRIKVERRLLLKSLAIFLLSFSPLLLFELRHNFVLTERLLVFFSFQSNTQLSAWQLIKGSLSSFLLAPRVFSRIFFLSGSTNLSCQILPCIACLKERGQIFPILWVLSLMIILFFLRAFFKKKKGWGATLLSLHFLIMFAGLFLYNLFLPGYIYEWLWVIFFPGFSLMAAYFLDFLWLRGLKIGVFLFLGIFIFFNLKTFFFLSNPFGLKVKEKAIKYALEEVGDSDFYLDSIGECFSFGGYRYLFWFFGREPVYSYTDELYWDWLYPRPEKERPNKGVVLVHHSEGNQTDFFQKYETYTEKAVSRKNFGQLEVLISKENDLDLKR